MGNSAWHNSTNRRRRKDCHDEGRYVFSADPDHGGRTRRTPLSPDGVAPQTCRSLWRSVPDCRLRAFQLPQFGPEKCLVAHAVQARGTTKLHKAKLERTLGWI